MTKEMMLLIRCLNGALTEFLRQVDGCEPDERQQVLPLPGETVKAAPAKAVEAVAAVAAEPAAVEPKAVRAEPEVDAEATDKEEIESAPPTAVDLADPSYPREKILNFLAKRGYDRAQWEKETRPELVQKAVAVLAAMQAAAPGVKRRGRPPKAAAQAPAAAPEQAETAIDVLKALPTGKVTQVATTLQLDPGAADVLTQVAALLVTPEAVRSFLSGLEEPEADEPEPVVVVAEAPAAPPLPSGPPVVSRPQVAATPPPAAAPRAESAEAKALLAFITKAHGYNGSLYTHVTSAEVSEYAPHLQQMLVGALAGADPVKLDRAKRYTGIMGCTGQCVDCHRGAAQIAACLETHNVDRDPMGVDKVLSGELLLRFEPTGHSPWDPATDGPRVAAVEAM
jgi:hypothetical protein